MLTAAEPMNKLVSFYNKVRPEGPGWSPVSARADVVASSAGSGLAGQFLNWILGCVLIYAFLFGIGYVVLGATLKGLLYLIAGVLLFAAIMRNLRRTSWQPASDEAAQVSEAVAET